MTRDFKRNNSGFITQKKIAEIVGYYFDSREVFEFQVINQGLENINIEIKINQEKYVIRIYNAIQFERFKRNDENILYELEFMDYLDKNGVPVPQIIKAKTGKLFCKAKLGSELHYVVCFEFIDGKEISAPSLAQIREVAKWQARMHNLSTKYKSNHSRQSDGPIDYYVWWTCFIKKNKRIKHKIGLEIERVMQELLEEVNPKTICKFPSGIIHSDMHKNNLRFTGGRLAGILDFDDCREGIFAEDISMFLHEILKHKKSFRDLRNKTDAFFSAYQKVRKLSLAERSMAIKFAMVKIYQLKYFDIYYSEQAGDDIDLKIQKTKKLVDSYPIFMKLLDFALTSP